ncbi:MAG: DoxX family protein [Deltaproteobacteria bacterium]|mgnify:CR=1 FL=1|jgi:hypothetical protein|nr:DoxX family protein [Deltaproteobacteria bacterium]MBT4265825.1 DoxX family protein [Deltaproteobacteria bacterium]MBT4638731.1 DoxX family protein [Deltaproteobacteria bacterium]MBT6503055.1 DoxX family protein [Deltaproteobacteria bacterium]MBT6614354.1 DoxX family protein [Deltaproteobacteria bacterium]
MRILRKANLIILVFLAGSSGITKIILMQQDVEFFGKYGFTNPILIVYGFFQLAGGIMLVAPKTRFFGAIIVAFTFAISAVVLILAGKMGPTIFTFMALVMLGIVIKQTMNEQRKVST